MSVEGVFYQFNDKKEDYFAFNVHSDRVKRGCALVQYDVRRPGKFYLKYESSVFSNHDEFECSLNQICQFYGLKNSESYRKANTPLHYELMGNLLGLYHRGFPMDPMILLNDQLNIIINGTDVKHYNERPGQVYLMLKPNMSAEKFQASVRFLCQHYGLEYDHSIRQSRMKDNYEIMGTWRDHYLKLISERASALEDSYEKESSPSRVVCQS